MSDDEDGPTSDELIHDDASVEVFTHIMDLHGIVVSSVTDGVVLGITREKLKHLLEVAEGNEDGRVVIFIKRGPLN